MSMVHFISLSVACVALLPSCVEGWDQPRTKGRTAFILEVGPGFLCKGPRSTTSVLYQVDTQGNLTDPFGSTRNVGWQTGVGLRASAQVLANNREGAEFLYTGLFNWTPFKTVTNDSNGVGVLTSPYTTTDWAGATEITWSTKTSYNSYEILIWYYVSPRFEDYFSIAVNFGGRFINIVDTDLFFSFATIASTPSELKATTNNWLRGGEVGFEFSVRPLSYFNWGVILR